MSDDPKKEEGKKKSIFDITIRERDIKKRNGYTLDNELIKLTVEQTNR